MINEKQMIERYSFFWKNVLPLHKLYIMNVNKNLTNRYQAEIGSVVSGRRRSFVSEVAFRLVKRFIEENEDFSIERAEQKVEEVEKTTKERFRVYKDDENGIINKLDDHEMVEVLHLSMSLNAFLNEIFDKKEIIFYPQFHGCGFVDSCYGDIIVEDTLIEVKTVDRNFRINDFKQLIIYCSLNSVYGEFNIQRICLINPRKGKYFLGNIDDICIMLSGKPSLELFGEVVEFVSSGDLSK